MDDTICFLNTDLELVSVENLTRLAAAFEAKGMWALEPATQGPDGLWYANFEMDPDNHEPEPNIAAMLDIVEVLEEPLRTSSLKCTLREFNLGYDCGSKPWAFNQVCLTACSGESPRRALRYG